MADMNDFLTRLQTALNTLDPAPDIVSIVPQDRDDCRPPQGKHWWVNISPATEDETPEPGQYYVSAYTAVVTVWIDSKKKHGDLVDYLAGRVAAVRDKLRYNKLSGWLRRALVSDRFAAGEYISGGESDTVYGYQMEVTGEKQDN